MSTHPRNTDCLHMCDLHRHMAPPHLQCRCLPGLELELAQELELELVQVVR